MQDCINIYNSGVLSAVIGQVIDAMWSDRITGELTLSFTSTVERVPEITPETSIEFRGQYFRAVQVRAETADGAFLLSVSCEQEAVTLVDDEVPLFDFEGAPSAALGSLLSGTGITGTAEYTDTIRLKEENTNRRAVLLVIAGMCGGELEYGGHTVKIVRHRGRTEVRNLTEIVRFSDLSRSADLQAGTESFEVVGWKPGDLTVGDEVLVDYEPLGIHAQRRIVGISYNPFNCTSVRIEVGDFVPDILESYRDVIEESADAAEKAEDAAGKIDKINGELADVVKKNELSAEIDTYVNSETGRASIVASLSGTYVTEDTLTGYVEKTEVSAEIGAYIDTEAGTAKIVNKLTGTFVKEDSLGNYVEKTELSAEIGAYIDTSAGTAKIISAASGTYQKKSDMSGYVTTTNLNTSIGQYIDSTAGTAKIISAASGTYQKKSDMSGYVTTTNLNTSIGQYIDSTAGTAKIVSAVSGEYATKNELSGYATTSALSEISQTVSNVKADITLSTSYTKNTIGTNVKALLQLVSNPNSSTIKIKADKIDFTGFTTFLRASDLSSTGTTTIDGGRITTGTIAADRIDVDNLKVSTIYGKGTYKTYTAMTTSGADLYVGGASFSASYTNVYLAAKTKVFFGDDKVFSICVDVIEDSIYSTFSASKCGTAANPWGEIHGGGLSSYHIIIADHTIRPSNTSTYDPFSLGTSTYPWNTVYAKEIYLDGKKLVMGSSMAGSSVTMGGSTSYYIVCNTSRELRPYSTSTTYPCYLGTSSYYWHYAYIGSNTASIGSSASSKIGFFGTTPVARKTVSSTADIATLITALKAYGLIG